MIKTKTLFSLAILGLSISTVFAQIQPYLIKVSGSDIVGGYLVSKLTAGTNITLTKTNSNGAESILISSSGGSSGWTFSTSTIFSLFTVNSPITFSTSSSLGTIGCTTASSGLAGCLSSTAFDTFNGRLSTTSAGTLFPTFAYGSSTYYLASNPNSFITASALSPYVTYAYASSTYTGVTNAYASSTFPSFSYASSSYYLATNPSSYITLGSLSASPPIRLTGGVFSSDLSTSTINNWTALNTFGNMAFTNATGTTLALGAGSVSAPSLQINGSKGLYDGGVGILSLTNGSAGISFNGTAFYPNTTGARDLGISSTNLWRNGYISSVFASSSIITNATTTNLGLTNASFPSILGSFLATDLTGKVIATTTAGGTTYTGTLPIRVTGSVISTDLATSSVNVWTALNTFNGGLTVGNATATNIGATNLTFASILGQSLATDLTGKVVATTSGGGTTYTGTYPILVNGSVISSGFTTSTQNVFSSLNTFVQASTTNLSISGFLHDSNRSVGTNGQVLTSTGTSTLWVTNSAGGLSGSGSNGLVSRFTNGTTLSTGILFDNSLVAGVNATSALTDFTIKGTSGKNPFTISSSSNTTIFSVNENGIINLATTTATTTPASGLNLYAQDIAGQTQLALKGKGRADRILQNAWWNSDFVYFQAGTTNTVTALSTWYNTIGTQSGTASRVLPTITSRPYNAMKRIIFFSVVTTQNQQVGTRSERLFFRGSGGATNFTTGGFFFTARIGLDNWTAGNRLFVGLSSCTTACLTGTTTLTNLANTVGFGVEGGGTQIVVLTNDASGVISTSTIGASQPALALGNMYDFYLYQSPNSPVMYWQVDDASSTAMIGSGVLSTNLPATTTLMSAHAQMSNGGNTVGGSASIGVNRIYIETER